MNAITGTADLYRLVWRSARGSRLKYGTALTMQALGFLCTLGSPLFLGLAVNAAQTSAGRDIGGITGWLAMMIGAVIVAWALTGPGRVMERGVAVDVHTDLADRLVGNALDVDIRWHESRHSGDTTHRIRTTVDAVTSFTESQFFYAKALFTFLGATVVLTVLSPPVGLAAVVGFGALTWVMVGMDGGLRERLDTHNAAVARLSGALSDTLGNITTVTTLGAGAASRRHVRTTLDQVARAARRIIVPMELKWWLITNGSHVLTVGLLIGFALIEWHTTGVVRVGFLVTISGYAAALHTAVEMLGGHWQQLLQLQAQARSADDLQAAQAGTRGDNDLPADWTRLTVRSLELRHPGPDGGRVSATDLTLRRGGRVALVGPSGAGKSSLLRSMAGLYRCERFDVEVDGTAAPQARSLAGLTGLITQETEVFATTVRSNIDLGTGADEIAIARAVHDARLTDVVDALPDGLDTDLDERGVNLSGGERQRVGLARGLLMTEACSLLLLDEPTSSLDPVTENAVLRNVLAARPDATVVAAVHRLHLLSHFDTVVFMRDGAVVDSGTCAELAGRQPDFARMLRSADDDPAEAA